MVLLKRLHAALKAARITWGRTGGNAGAQTWGWDNWGSAATPDVDADFNLWENSVVASCLGWLWRTFPEPSLQVLQATADGDEEPVKDHPLLELLAEPNEDYDGSTLWMGFLFSWVCAGNAYGLKLRDGAGRVRELYWVPHWEIRPVWSGGRFLDGYERRIDGEVEAWAKRDVLHFRFGFNPLNPREGFSPLSSCLGEVSQDNEGGAYSRAILRQMGIAGAVVSPQPGTSITEAQALTFKALWQARITGSERGKPIVSNLPINVEFPETSPEKISLSSLRMVPEDRICSSIGLSAMVVGLSAGAAHKTYANYEESNKAAWTNCLMPTQGIMGQQATRSLLWADFDQDRRRRLGFNYKRVRALLPDMNVIAARTEILAPITSVNERRAMLDLKEIDGGDETPVQREERSRAEAEAQRQAQAEALRDSAGDRQAQQERITLPAGNGRNGDDQ